MKTICEHGGYPLCMTCLTETLNQTLEAKIASILREGAPKLEAAFQASKQPPQMLTVSRVDLEKVRDRLRECRKDNASAWGVVLQPEDSDPIMAMLNWWLA